MVRTLTSRAPVALARARAGATRRLARSIQGVGGRSEECGLVGPGRVGSDQVAPVGPLRTTLRCQCIEQNVLHLVRRELLIVGRSWGGR